jgi:ATP-binding cassette subfamily B (MDR/TAP) protein 1
VLIPSNGQAASLSQIGKKINGQVNYLVGIAVASAMAQFLTTFCNEMTLTRVGNKVKNAYFRSLVKQEVGFFDMRKTGHFLNNITEDTLMVQQVFGEKLPLCTQYFSQAVSGLIMAFYESWKMAIVMLAAAPIITVIFMFSGNFVRFFTRKTKTAVNGATTIANEVISSMRTVRSMSGEVKEIRRYKDSLDAVNFTATIKSFSNGFAAGLGFSAIWATSAIAFYYGGYLINNSQLSIGQFFEVFGFMLFVVIGLGLFFQQFPSVIAGIAVTRFIMRVMIREPQIRYSGGKTIEGGMKGEIKFDHVQFRYPTRPDQLVLKDFCLDIKKGQVLGIVGESGSGKSTTVALLEKWYEPTAGLLTIDGVDIKELDPFWLHMEVGIVTQEPVLFATSIKNNILYSVNNPSSISMDDIYRVCKAANCYDFIMKLPDKFDTLCGERGAQLSGGQKQRIAIARAMLQDPKILLLDEATSALDTESEHLVQEALEKLMVGRTTIVIAHRLATIKKCDLICVIDKGVLMETGTHDELLAKNGMYAQLAKRQMAFGHKADGDMKQSMSVESLHSHTDSNMSKQHSTDNLEKKGEKLTHNDQNLHAALPTATETHVVDIPHQADVGWMDIGQFKALQRANASICKSCHEYVDESEKVEVGQVGTLHRSCLRCTRCKKLLIVGDFKVFEGNMYCPEHYQEIIDTHN